jgi:hypothetical protein
MSISVQPPEFQFTGLNYNPNFWITATGDLTQSVANTLYLRKTVIDTASALETFNGGINTTFLNGLSPIFNTEICSNLTSGELYLGVNAAGTNGRIGHIHIGDANNLPSGAGIHINNGTTNASNTNISNGTTTTGNVNILSGTTSNGNVNIKTGTGAGQINLGNTSGTQTITFNRPLTLGYTIAPVVGQIGYSFVPVMTRVDTLPVGTAVPQTGTIVNTTSSVVPAGMWIITATQNISCTVAAGTINSITLTVNNTTVGGVPIGVQGNQSSWVQPVGTAIGSLNVSTANYSGATGSIYAFTYSINYTGVGATYVFFGNQTRFTFTRVG